MYSKVITTVTFLRSPGPSLQVFDGVPQVISDQNTYIFIFLRSAQAFTILEDPDSNEILEDLFSMLGSFNWNVPTFSLIHSYLVSFPNANVLLFLQLPSAQIHTHSHIMIVLEDFQLFTIFSNSRNGLFAHIPFFLLLKVFHSTIRFPFVLNAMLCWHIFVLHGYLLLRPLLIGCLGTLEKYPPKCT